MAQITITPVTSTGLFNVDSGKMQLLSGSEMTVDITADLKDCKDAVIALIDVSNSGGTKNTFVFKSSEGNKDIEVELGSEPLNVIRFTTKGIKKADGSADFRFITENGMGIDGLGAKIALIKSVDVVNH